MTKPARIRKTPAEPLQRRISAKVRQAITYRVTEGLSWRQAARKAGMSEAGIHKARKTAHVAELLEKTKTEYVQGVESLKAPIRAQAIEVGRDLLHNAKSESIKARMVEFFARDPQANQVNVAVQVNNQAPGYEYVKPGQRLVVVTDNPSGTHDAESQ